MTHVVAFVALLAVTAAAAVIGTGIVLACWLATLRTTTLALMSALVAVVVGSVWLLPRG